MSRKLILIFLFIAILSLVLLASNQKPVYLDPSYPIDVRISDLMKRMTIQEKIALLSGTGFEVPENKRLKIPALKMSDGPAGVRWGKSTAFPAPVAMAATWNPELIEKIGNAMAEELKAKGRNVLLAPCVNIHRIPVGGRNFESYGEDPFLAGKIAEGFIRGVQKEGVIACVKHYVANNQEWNRTRIDVIVSERALQEIYLPAFRKAVKDAGVWCVMAAYNKVNGDYCSENKHLLIDILREQWGFRGFVVSDWGATHSTVKAALAGLDIEMPYGKHFGKKLLEAVKEGSVSEAIINDKVKRILTVMFEAGLFSLEPQEEKENISEREIIRSHNSLALKAAQESMVLLKNDNLLPIDLNKIRSIAVIGPNARYARTGGGGSSMVKPYYKVSPLEAIEKRAGNSIKVFYAPGTGIKDDVLPVDTRYLLYSGKNGLLGEYFNNGSLKGKPVIKRIDPELYFNWAYDPPEPEIEQGNDRNEFSIRWTGKLLPPVSGKYRLKFLCDGGIRVYLNGKVVLENWKDPARNMVVSLKSVEIPLQGGKKYDIKIEYSASWAVSEFKFGWEIPGVDPLREAVEIAKKADVALIFAGLSAHFETESWDRPDMEIPEQNRLILEVVRANPRTAVILINGSPILINKWVDRVPAILEAWYPGQEEGNAIASIIFGDYNPSGKLPFSWFKSPRDCPGFKGYKDKSLKAIYHEGIFVGYRYLDRNDIEPLYPFGYGLSYTNFSYKNIQVQRILNGNIEVSLELSNTGKRPGAEVVQVYVAPPEGNVPRPEKELKGFRKVFLNPGESKVIRIIINPEDLRYFDAKRNKWVLQRGKYTFLVGSSSRDIRLRAEIKL